MIVEIYHLVTYGWRFDIKGKNGKIIARSLFYKSLPCLRRSVEKLTNTVNWKIRAIK